MTQPSATFTTETTPDNRQLVVCMVGDQRGAARVSSKGLDDAKARAEAQARTKYAEAQ
jgi:hypothetical protein